MSYASSPLPPSRKHLFCGFFLGSLTSLACPRFEARLILHDDVQVGLLLRQSRTRLELGFLRGREISVRAPDRTTERVDLRVRGVLPGLRPYEVSDPKLAVREALGFVVTHPRCTSFGRPPVLLGSAFRVVRGFSCAHGVPELNRRRIDVAIAVLAQRLERVLRIPRHS